MKKFDRVTAETIYHGGSEYGRLWKEFAVELQTAVDKVPEEYRDSVTIEIQGYSSYDSTEVEVELKYQRPMNDVELAAAEAQDKYAQDFERRQYEELKKKFGE